MKKLVIEKSSNIYPNEFLFARLRSRLSENYPKAGFGEIRWVHSTMNPKLFLIFYPFFIIIHLNKIVSILRYKFFQKEKTDIEEVFKNTLFSDEFKKFAFKTFYPNNVKEELTRNFDIFSNFNFKDYKNTGEVEDKLLTQIILYLLKNTKHKVMKNFVSNYIDYLNIKQVYKILRWKLENRTLIDGGFCDKKIFLKIVDTSDMHVFYEFLNNYFKEGFKELDIEIMDILLIERMLNEARKYTLSNNTTGFLLYYLLYCYYLDITG